MSNIIELLNENSILVPEIQRDYAYGREYEQDKVKGFIDAIFRVLASEQDVLRLNYIYGVPKRADRDGNDKIVLIDGQQRVTTLYLIRLFLTVNAGVDCTSFIKSLSYESRTTSKAFCEFLGNNSDVLQLETLEGNEAKSIKEKINVRKEFYKKWYNDPTVFSMISVLELINAKCGELNLNSIGFGNYLDRLQYVQFEFIKLEGFKKEEALYMTMNGRGKQLTPFEVFKSKVFTILNVVDEDIEHSINNVWIPAFWTYSINLSTSDDKMRYAADHHDRYLYNYFRYVISMIWCENCIVEKNSKPAPVDEILEWLLAENNREHAKLISFAMNLFVETFSSNTSSIFTEWLSNDLIQDDTQRTNIFWNKDLDFVKQCCESDNLEEFDLLCRCLLWAFILFRYNEASERTANYTLRDYFVLMRDVYAASWDSNTPTGITKNPTEHLVAKAIMEFRHIVDEKTVDPKYETQRNTFLANNTEKYRILNNYSTRGCSSNISKVVQQNDGYTCKQASIFAQNIDFLITHVGIQNMKALEDQEIQSYFITFKDDYRLYLPCTKNILQSLFSMRNWTYSDWYEDFIWKLSNRTLNESSRGYSSEQWQYYFQEYKDCFIFDNSFCAFDFMYNEEDKPDFFSLRVVYGLRATIRQVTSPYILAAFKKNMGENSAVKADFAPCEKSINNHNIILIGNNSLRMDDQSYPLTGDCDLVERIAVAFQNQGLNMGE